MKVHDTSTDTLVQKLRQNKEESWERFLESYKQDLAPLTNKEILYQLHNLQEYLFLDFPESKPINQELLISFSEMCSIAISLFKELEEATVDNHYITKKLYCIIGRFFDTTVE